MPKIKMLTDFRVEGVDQPAGAVLEVVESLSFMLKSMNVAEEYYE